MIHRYAPVVFLLLTLVSSDVFAQDVVDDLPKGSINWSRGVVTAKGYGALSPGISNPAQARLLAERAAISDARRNLLETVGEVRIDASSTVGSMMTKSDVITSKISGIVKGSSVIDKRYLDDGSVEVTVQMPVTGAFLDVVINEVKSVPSITMGIPASKPAKKEIPKTETKPVISAVPQEPSTTSKPAEPVQEAKATPESEKKMDLSKVNYSGLIIDAREVEVKPALMPKVLAEKGDVIYSAANMQKEEAVKTGVVGYAKEVDAAKKHPRVTETPVVVAAVKGSGEKRSDVIISDRDAQIITTTEPTLGYLKKGRVMIVYK